MKLLNLCTILLLLSPVSFGHCLVVHPGSSRSSYNIDGLTNNIRTFKQTRLSANPSSDNNNVDDGDVLESIDEEWEQFQTQRQESSKKPIRLRDFAPKSTDGLLDAQRDLSAEESNQSVLVGLLCLVAMACLAAVFYSGVAPVFVDDVNVDAEDVDSAKGRFNALTGGVWF